MLSTSPGKESDFQRFAHAGIGQRILCTGTHRIPPPRPGIRPRPSGILTALQARADAAGPIGWDVGVDSTTCRAHQYAAEARKRGIRRPSRRVGRATSRPIMGWGAFAAV
ncbi:hypothetical protein GCM10023259_050160 [Thermocatellispora tengchongensis]